MGSFFKERGNDDLIQGPQYPGLFPHIQDTQHGLPVGAGIRRARALARDGRGFRKPELRQILPQ